MKLEDIEIQPFFCSQSCIKCAKGCERKWFFKYRWGLDLKTPEQQESADLGKIYHKYQQLGSDRIEEARAWVRQWQSRLSDQIDKGEDLDGSIARTISSLSTARDKAEAMAKIFWEKYPTPSYFKVLGTELKVKTTITINIPTGKAVEIPIEGTIDKLIQISEGPRSGDIWIRDHKSTGRPLKMLFDGLPYSIQARLYRILAEAYCTQNNIQGAVKGFIFDGILKPGIKLCKADQKNAAAWKCSLEEAYLRRVKMWYAEKEEEKPKSTIRSESIIYNEPIYSYELQRALTNMYYLSQMSNNPLAYSRDITRTHCSFYEKTCIYMSLCDSPVKNWPELIDQKYRIKPIVEDEEGENEDSET